MALPEPSSTDAVLITGASAGIGAELARQLAARGHNVVLVARRADRLEEIADELRRAHGVVAEVRACDLGEEPARKRLITELREGELTIAVLCNNAGFGTYGRFHELEQRRERQEVRLNVDALHDLTGAFLPDMVERGTGAVLNVASIAGSQPLPCNATYSATKAFVVAFSEAVHTDLRGTGVSCTALCPGPVATEFAEVAGVSEAEGQLPGFLRASAAEVARAGIDGMVAGKRIVTPGLAARALSAGGRFAPRGLLLPIAGKLAGDRLQTP